MSYARKSNQYSDIYLFGTWYNGLYDTKIVWECMTCFLKPLTAHPVLPEVIKYYKEEYGLDMQTTYENYPSSFMFNLKAVYRHLRHHLMAGHKVPIEAIQRVVAEYYAVPVSRLQELWPLESWQFEEE
jgi:hypothetical protein